MRPSGQGYRPATQLARRIGTVLILVGILAVLAWLGIKLGRAYVAGRGALAHVRSLQQMLEQPSATLLDDSPALKAEIAAASEHLATLRAETEFLDPLLSNLGWVPQYGPELAATPHLTAMAADLSGAAADLTTVLDALLPILDTGQEDALASSIAILQQHQPLLKRAHSRLQHAAYERTLFDPATLDDGPYGQMGMLLARLDPYIPTLVQGLGTVDGFLPQADTLLGIDRPRRYLLIGQNNYELRATGGFMGSMGVLAIERGRITGLDYRRSYDWDNPNREKVQPPFPYVRYMRFGAWFIRDANWYADFPTSAQTIEYFWRLDGHEPVEGVIALDTVALQYILQAIGPLEVPGYGIPVGGENMLETVWEAYRQDRGFLAALTEAVATRLQQPEVAGRQRLPALLGALFRSLEEKHILLYFNDAGLQGAIDRAGWSGAIRSDAGDFLMVVDADFSYAEVNRFIEQEIQYHVTLDHNLRVQQSTVTLTYWNHFDRWGSAETRELFGGACFDPQTEDLVLSPGCYGNYIRLYVPRGSRFVSAEGFDDGMEYREESGRAVIAGYVRVLPGEERTLAVTYIPPVGPVGGQYRLTLQKQPGTQAIPISVVVEVAGSTPVEAAAQTDLLRDRVITAMWQQEQLVLSGEGPMLTQLDPQSQVRRQAFAEGLALWEAGHTSEAVARWQEAAVADLVLDRANMLLSRGEREKAVALCQAALQVSPDLARAYFLLGKAALEAGDATAATEHLERSVALDPDNFAARLELGLLYESQGDMEKAYAHLQHADPQEANHELWLRAWPYFNSGRTQAGLDALELIIRLNPKDTNARYVLAEQLRLLKRYDEALAAYDALRRAAPGDVRFFIGRGQLYADQGRGDAAIADLETAVGQAPRNAEAWFYLGLFRWRFRKDAAGAVAALEQAVALSPNAWYAGELGNVQRDSGNLEAAAAAYELAVTLSGRSAYTWWSLGQIYERQERWEKAATAYAEAVRQEPGNAWLHAALAHACERAGERDKALAEYQAALALQPGQAEWLEAVERLK